MHTIKNVFNVFIVFWFLNVYNECVVALETHLEKHATKPSVVVYEGLATVVIAGFGLLFEFVAVKMVG